MQLKVLGISSGIGVSLFPFKKYVIGNVENRAIFKTPGNEQWKANFGDLPLLSTLPENADCDLIISSPDCGSGSILRMSRSKKFGNHKSNESLKLFFDGVNKYKPKFFLFENLKNLFLSFPKEEFKKELPDYRLRIINCSVSAFGNPQKNRKRLIIVGIRRDLPESLLNFFKKPKIKCQKKTCQKIYGDLDNLGESERLQLAHVTEPINEVISIYARKRMSLKEIKKTWQNRLKGKKRWYVEDSESKFKTAPGVYRNLNKSFPATARKANRQFDHRGLTLSPRQLARVQGVPDNFILYINENKLKYWINKTRAAVTKTPPMEISTWMLNQLLLTQKLWK